MSETTKVAPLTPEELREMRERCEKTTGGRWVYIESDNVLIKEDDGVPIAEKFSDTFDAAFIARARTDMPRLLGEVERLRSSDKLMKFEAEWLRKESDRHERGRRRALEGLRILDHCIWALEDITKTSWSAGAVSKAKEALARVDEYKHHTLMNPE